MSCLHLHILGSGSKGNCALIEGPQGLIMVDDGLSRRETLKRMAELGSRQTTSRLFSLLMSIAITSRASMSGASTGTAPSLPAGALFRTKNIFRICLSRNSIPATPYPLPASTCKPTQHHTMSSIQSVIDSTPSMIPSALPPTPESYRAKP